MDDQKQMTDSIANYRRPHYRKLFSGEPVSVPDESLDNLAQILSNELRYPRADGENKGQPATLLAEREHRRLSLGFKQPKVPAGYTYLGQFIVHDISRIEKTERHQKQDLPWANDEKDDYWAKVRNFHQPDFNLESVYSAEPSVDSRWVDSDSELPFLRLGLTARSGGPRQTSSLQYPCDLPRKPGSYEAAIPDDRNDENLILAQTHLAFMKFHNVLVAFLSTCAEFQTDADKSRREKIFEKARELNIRYYQQTIVDDFLPRIVEYEDLEWVKKNLNSKELSYQPFSESFVPVEFAIAVFRFGHSMIRSRYNFNFAHRTVIDDQGFESANLDQLQTFTGKNSMNNNPEKALPSDWIIDWSRFYRLNRTRTNAAEKINASLPKELLQLVPRDDSSGRANSIAALDLFRSYQFRLASGQDIARAMDLEALTEEQIAYAINIKNVNPNITKEQRLQIKRKLIKNFSGGAPLWYYILLEAQYQKTRRLGPVGGRLVAQTILQLIYNSKISVLREPWNEKDAGFLQDGKFSMPLMIQTIRDNRLDESVPTYPTASERFDEINPLRDGVL